MQSTQVDSPQCGPAEYGSSTDVEQALKAAIAHKIGEPKYRLWFGEGVHLALRGDGEALEIQVPTDFFREWIQRHFAASVLEAAAAVTGKQVDLRFSLRDEADPAVGDIVAQPGPEPPAPKKTVVVPLPGHPGILPSAPITVVPANPSQPGTRRFNTPGDGGRQASGRGPSRDLASEARTEPGDSSIGIRSNRRLDNFVVGPCNRLASAAGQEFIQGGGTAFNPLVIHGGVGLGKTHLLEAIVHGLRAKNPGLNILQTTAEAFTNGFLEAMRTGTLASFRQRHRKLGALAMDDVHFLAGTRATQNEFLHTFNALLDRGAPIVLTSDQHPRQMTRLSDELITRFLGGMVVKLEPPDQATRRAILQAKSEGRGAVVPAAVLDYIAEHLRSSVRELEGALHSVLAHALLTGKRLDLALARSALRDTLRHTAHAIGLRDVERAVCQLFQIDPDALKSNSRARAVTYPRMLAIYLARKHTGAPYSEIGRYFGGRNHSTIISSEKKVKAWLRDEQSSALLPGFESVAEILNDLERTLSAA